LGDRLLVCSDGLFNEVSTGEIAGAIGSEAPTSTVADSLVELAISRGARDNVSLIVAEVDA